ncbi:MAG TPA: hypothetical protein VH082_08965 [Rudaea sp.]|nr:hypothetical protein [Rudaea sp.]
MRRNATSIALICRSSLSLILLAFAHSAAAQTCQADVLDDHVIHIHTAQDIDTVRGNLIQFIWGRPTLPVTADPTITSNVASPFDCGGANLDHVDQFNVAMGPGPNGVAIDGWAWHFRPSTRNGRLAIVEDGHMPCDSFTESGADALGLQMTVNALVENGYDVLFVLMPLYVPDQCLTNHDLLFEAGYLPAVGSPIQYFLDTTLRSVNYLIRQDVYSDISMMGLSGGGWTTTLYAAVDTRVSLSFPVAGSIPLYLRGIPTQEPMLDFLSDASPDAASGEECNDYGDAEQTFPALYEIAGYPDLYVLGSYGAGRQQTQILNRNDNCCFGQEQEADSADYDSDQRTYEASVRAALQSLASGTFRQEIDETSIVHQISRNAFYNVIAGQLGGLRPTVGAASSANAFMRGNNGHLWQNDATSGWSDLGFRTVGTPSVVENAVHTLQVAARSTLNAPELIYTDGAGWSAQALPTSSADGSIVLPAGKIASDPVMQSNSAGELDIVAQASDFSFYRWHVTGSGVTLDRPDGGANTVGIPGLSSVSGELNLTYRTGMIDDPETGCVEEPNAVYQSSDSGGGWLAPSRTNGTTRAYLAAGTIGSASESFLVGEEAQLWNNENASTDWLQITSAVRPFVGTPGIPTENADGYGLYVRADGGDLWFAQNRENLWSTEKIALQSAESMVDSPLDTADGVYWLGADNQIRFRGSSDIDQVLNRVDTLFRDDYEGVVSP